MPSPSMPDIVASGPPESARTAGSGFGRRLAAVTGVVVLLLALWMITDVLLLAFAAVLVAVLLRSAASFLERHLPIGETVSIILALVLVVAVMSAFILLAGAQALAQARELAARAPDLLATLGDQFGIHDLARWVTDFASRASFVEATAGYSMLAASGLASALLVVAGGVYFALSPRLYRDGLVRLLPPSARARGKETLCAVGEALRLWLLGQLVAMSLVGCMTTIGLWLLGVEAALALGIFSGLMDFIPVVGPIIGAVPAIAVAAAESPMTALWVALLFLVIQQIEGNLISPLIQQSTLHLPPALTLFAIVAFGVLFGPLGVLLATPLTAVACVAAERLWIGGVLGEDEAPDGQLGARRSQPG